MVMIEWSSANLELWVGLLGWCCQFVCLILFGWCTLIVGFAFGVRMCGLAGVLFAGLLRCVYAWDLWIC